MQESLVPPSILVLFTLEQLLASDGEVNHNRVDFAEVVVQLLHNLVELDLLFSSKYFK